MTQALQVSLQAIQLVHRDFDGTAMRNSRFNFKLNISIYLSNVGISCVHQLEHSMFLSIHYISSTNIAFYDGRTSRP